MIPQPYPLYLAERASGEVRLIIGWHLVWREYADHSREQVRAAETVIVIDMWNQQREDATKVVEISGETRVSPDPDTLTDWADKN